MWKAKWEDDADREAHKKVLENLQDATSKAETARRDATYWENLYVAESRETERLRGLVHQANANFQTLPQIFPKLQKYTRDELVGSGRRREYETVSVFQTHEFFEDVRKAKVARERDSEADRLTTKLLDAGVKL